jgi:hypothetical protein
MKNYRPGILASQAKRVADAHERSRPIIEAIAAIEGAPSIPEIMRALNDAGHRGARGGAVSYNTVTRALARAGAPAPEYQATRRTRSTKRSTLKNIRARLKSTETFRTPAYSFTPLMDAHPEWFEGRGFDPCAGDGRMIREIVERGNAGPHFVNDLREEELAALQSVPGAIATVGDYLAMINPPEADFLITNAPFTKAMDFVEKARTHILGPIMILQSINWQTTRERSEWLRRAGLAHVLNLPRRPKWEVDTPNLTISNNIWDYAWFVFLPGHSAPPIMDWLVEE